MAGLQIIDEIKGQCMLVGEGITWSSIRIIELQGDFLQVGCKLCTSSDLKMKIDCWESIHHFFYHHVEVEDCAEQHEVPEGDDGGKEAEDGSDPWGVLRVEFADVNKFFVLQLAQRSLPLLIIRVNPAMFLVSQEVFYLLPSKVSLSFLS